MRQLEHSIIYKTFTLFQELKEKHKVNRNIVYTFLNANNLNPLLALNCHVAYGSLPPPLSALPS